MKDKENCKIDKKYLYYGWVNHKEADYSVNKYPIIKEQNITGIKTYLVDEYLVVGEHHSTRYIEKHYLDREIKLNGDRVGMMTLDYETTLKWVRDKKSERELELTKQLEKIQRSVIETYEEA